MLELLLPFLVGATLFSLLDDHAPHSKSSNDGAEDDDAEQEPHVTVLTEDDRESYSGSEENDDVYVKTSTSQSLFYDWDRYTEEPDGAVVEVRGGAGDDHLHLSGGGYRVFGDQGADLIESGDASDVAIYGGQDDTVVGGIGEKVYVRLEGNAHFEGREGNDFVLSSSSTPTDLGDGDDVFVGLRDGSGAEENLVFGGSGNDYLAGSMRESNLWSAHSSDQGNVSSDCDTLYGGEGDDTIIGSHGDLLFGGTGTDTFHVVLNMEAHLPAALIKDFDPSSEQIEIRAGQGDGESYSPEYFQGIKFSDFTQSINRDGETVIEDRTGQQLVRIAGGHDIKVGFESWDCDPRSKSLIDLQGHEIARADCDVLIRGQQGGFL